MLYAGLDCSTQGLSAVVIDVEGSRRDVVFRSSLSFEDDLPEFATRHGVLPSAEPGVVHAPPLMWATALDRMLGRLAEGVDRSRLRALSGSAQQHGSVYSGPSPRHLTRQTSPVWMDSSTGPECREIEAAAGGPAALAQLTGSRAFPRFTGPQIRKFARESPGAYERTQRVHLVSSYLASLLIGGHAPIDHADGSGMNLMDLRSREWSEPIVDATAPELSGRLPGLVPSSTTIGGLAAEWRVRFALPDVQIVAWSGDNPCSLIGTGLVEEGQLAISLGTSDTIFGPMREPRVSADGTGHVFASPTGDYMGITVFRNGSLARERIRDRYGMDWARFSAALAATPAGNGGMMLLPWFEPEITPAVPRPLVASEGLDDAPPAAWVRALVEGQMMSMARHSAWMGVTPAVIHATGGASANPEILQVIADVFSADVDRYQSEDSAALGAALRAWQAASRLPWPEVVGGFTRPVAGSVVRPDPKNVTVYRALQGPYMALERSALDADDRLRRQP